MRILLDTHILIWMFMDDPRLSPHARELILDRDNQLYCSAASIWEVELKHEKRPKNNINATKFASLCEKSDVAILPISGEHVMGIGALPMVHKDPFDRLMIAQAQVEGMSFLTHDQTIWKYGLPFIIEA